MAIDLHCRRRRLDLFQVTELHGGIGHVAWHDWTGRCRTSTGPIPSPAGFSAYLAGPRHSLRRRIRYSIGTDMAVDRCAWAHCIPSTQHAADIPPLRSCTGSSAATFSPASTGMDALCRVGSSYWHRGIHQHHLDHPLQRVPLLAVLEAPPVTSALRRGYLTIAALTIAVLALCTVLLTVLVDPYRMYGTPSIPGLTELKP